MLRELLSNPKVLDAIAELVVTGIMLAGAATPLLLRWFKAHGVAIDAAQAAQIDAIAKAASGYAEEWARARIKGGQAPNGDEKLAVAIEAARSLATGSLTKLAADTWGIAIQSKLPEMRARTNSTTPAIEVLNDDA
jgi:hypothetical protein